jgi:hypothetical protein
MLDSFIPAPQPSVVMTGLNGRPISAAPAGFDRRLQRDGEQLGQVLMRGNSGADGVG